MSINQEIYTIQTYQDYITILQKHIFRNQITRSFRVFINIDIIAMLA